MKSNISKQDFTSWNWQVQNVNVHWIANFVYLVVYFDGNKCCNFMEALTFTLEFNKRNACTE